MTGQALSPDTDKRFVETVIARRLVPADAVARLSGEHERAIANGSSVGSLAEWQRALALHVEVRPLGRADLKRVVQLLNKTNQMNLRTRRTSETELLAWAADGTRRLWALRVRDRFGDAGLTGVVSVEQAGEEARIVDFVLSCRVFGREIERVMVHVAVEHARAAGARTVVAEYLPTPRNKPALEFWRASGFAEEAGAFRWPAAEPYRAPDFITVEVARA